MNCDDDAVRTHDLLEIDAKQFVSAHASVPEWVKDSLIATPFVVVRRGAVTAQGIPVGVRGRQRNQRWASSCSADLVKSITTPPQLLKRPGPSQRENAIPAFHALNILKNRWTELDHSWGPGGSVGFELATGSRVTRPESDLDIIIYAARRMTADEALILCTQTMDLPATVDIRVETTTCGFFLAEFARNSGAGILLRMRDGLLIGDDPWSDVLKIENIKQPDAERLNAP